MAELILALDVKTPAQGQELLLNLGQRLRLVKIGPRLFAQGGSGFVARVQEMGFKVFLDLKLHDIPNTVALAVEALAGMGLWALTIHTAGGRAMLRAARQAKEEAGAGLNLLGVTVLTSLDQETWEEVAPGGGKVAQAVAARAGLCAQEGLEGLVCSPQELTLVRDTVGPDLVTVVPGIRPAAGGDDQRRTATPARAAAQGADYLVVGRPILQAQDPAAAVEEIVCQLREPVTGERDD